MLHPRLLSLAATAVAGLALAGSAAAFDCIRVSASLQGLQQSTRSGNWLLFDFSSAEAVQRTFASVGEDATDEEAACFAEVYAGSGEPLYFALGIGVAGPRGVLAWHNENKPIGDRKGIDHLEQTGIIAVFDRATEECAGLGR
jgi:hypothetical protein